MKTGLRSKFPNTQSHDLSIPPACSMILIQKIISSLTIIDSGFRGVVGLMSN